MTNECVPQRNIYFSWTMDGVGFGELGFYMEDGVLKCANECMSKERIKKILCSMVDNAELNDEPFKNTNP